MFNLDNFFDHINDEPIRQKVRIALDALDSIDFLLIDFKPGIGLLLYNKIKSNISHSIELISLPKYTNASFFYLRATLELGISCFLFNKDIAVDNNTGFISDNAILDFEKWMNKILNTYTPNTAIIPFLNAPYYPIFDNEFHLTDHMRNVYKTLSQYVHFQGIIAIEDSGSRPDVDTYANLLIETLSIISLLFILFNPSKFLNPPIPLSISGGFSDLNQHFIFAARAQPDYEIRYSAKNTFSDPKKRKLELILKDDEKKFIEDTNWIQVRNDWNNRNKITKDDPILKKISNLFKQCSGLKFFEIMDRNNYDRIKQTLDIQLTNPIDKIKKIRELIHLILND